MSRSLPPSPTTLVLSASLCLASGCDLLGELTSQDTHISVMATHHATPEDGQIPDRGGDGEARVFDSDLGWTVTLRSAYLVTADVGLRTCKGDAIAIDLYYGVLAEDLSQLDLDRFSVGGVQVTDAEVCGVTVTYGPFDSERGTMLGEDTDEIEGATAYLAGIAAKGDAKFGFEVRITEEIVFEVPLVDEPLRIRGKESFPVELTVSKTYDRFFDGIDFADFDHDQARDQIVATLERTRVDVGEIVGVSP